MNVLGWNSSMHVFAVPLQWSVASHAPPFDVPVHTVAVDENTSAGHALDEPVHVSASSH